MIPAPQWCKWFIMVVCYFHGKNCFVSIIGGQCFYGSSEPNVKKMVMHGSLWGRIMLTNDMPTSAEKYQTVRHYIICLLIKKKYSCTNTPKQCYMHIYTHNDEDISSYFQSIPIINWVNTRPHQLLIQFELSSKCIFVLYLN